MSETAAKIGTLAWARKTGGRMSPAERRAQLAQAVKRQLLMLPAQLQESLGLKRARPLPVDVDKLLPPDSEVCRRAEALCTQVSTPALLNHCQRTYVWGRVLAALDHVAPVDDELLHVACLLHDLGLTPHPAAHGPEVHCFAVGGAWAARRFAEEARWEAARADALAEAICLHMNLSVTLAEGAVAFLLSASAGLDVVGARASEVPAADVQRVLARFPRHGFKNELLALFAEQARERPDSRAHFFCTRLPIRRLVKRAPFPE